MAAKSGAETHFVFKSSEGVEIHAPLLRKVMRRKDAREFNKIVDGEARVDAMLERYLSAEALAKVDDLLIEDYVKFASEFGADSENSPVGESGA